MYFGLKITLKYEKYLRFVHTSNYMRKIVLVAIMAISSFHAAAQYGDRDSNRIGINVGLNQFTLNTSDLETTPGTGWNAGLSMRGNFYNDWDMVYGIQFSENNFKVGSVNSFAQAEDINFKLSSAQISLLLSYKFIANHLSVEFGPMLQVNGKLAVNEADEDNIINTHDDTAMVTAKELTEVTNFNFYPTVGITAGIKRLRLNVTYQYGVNNLLSSVDSGSGAKFSGHAGILSGNIIFYL